MSELNNSLNFLLPKQQRALKALSTKVNTVLITGAGGFVGSALCRFLRLANINVIGFSRNYYPHLDAIGVNQIQGDLHHFQSINQAMKDCDLIFHVASKAGVWGDKASYFNPNVIGTKNVINACLENGIKHLVYTSTPSVTFNGKDESGIDETEPYATQFLNFYGLSKAIAESDILKANSERLKTVALRPHLIWGPGDQHLIPRVIARAKAGKLKLVGNKDKLVDTIYIDNAVYAHLLAALALFSDQPKCAGKAYFLSNEQPIFMAEMLNKILNAAQLPPVTSRIPATIAYLAGALLEWWYLRTNNHNEPIMTRFVAKQLSTSHYYDISAAKQDFDYEALISIDEGMSELKKSLQVTR